VAWVLLSIGAVAQETPYIEFQGVMVGSWDQPGGPWHHMIAQYYAWTTFSNCQFVATSSNLECLQGKDLSKLTIKAAMDGLRNYTLTAFEKTAETSDQRVYTLGEFEIAYDGVRLVDGTADIELAVNYIPDHSEGGINAFVDNFYNGPVLNGSDLAHAFSSIERKGHQWHATILTLSETTVDNNIAYFDTTIRLIPQAVGRDVGVVQPQVGVPALLGNTGAALSCRSIADAGGGAVTAVERLVQPAGLLPANVDTNSVNQHWSIGTTMLSFNADLALAYDTNLIRNVQLLRVYRRLSSTNAWLSVPVADVSDGVVTVTNVTHFSEWMVAGMLTNSVPLLPLDMPGGVSESDRLMYKNWIETNKVAWGTMDFSDTPAEDFQTAWLLGRKPAAGFAGSVSLKVTEFERTAHQPAETNAMPVAWLLGEAERPAVVRTKVELKVGGVNWNGPVNGNVVIQTAASLQGPWQRSVGQLDAEARMSFTNGVADLMFNRPTNALFYRPALARDGRTGAKGRVQKWGTATTNEWVSCVVDAVPTNGLYTSVAFSPAGVMGICYYDSLAKDLKYASYHNGTLRIERVDTEGDVGEYCDLAFAPSGRPAISYYDATRTKLKYAAYDGARWVIQIVDTNEYSGFYSSLAFSTNGTPAISYQGYVDYNESLKYAQCTGGVWVSQIVDASNYSGFLTSLAFTPAGRPSIAYALNIDSQVNYAVYNGSSWSIQYTYLSRAADLELAYTTNGNPAIVSIDTLNRRLMYAEKKSGWAGNATIVETLTDITHDGCVSLSIAPGGRPAIAYYDATNRDLKYAKYNGTAWTRETLDAAGETGLYPSLAFSPKGRTTVAYFDKTQGCLKVAEYVEVVRIPE
jgi:hypothetical protein